MSFKRSIGLVFERITILSSKKTSKSHVRRPKKSFTSGPPKNTTPNWRQSGTPEIVIGTTILSLLALDHYLQNKQDESRRKFMSTLQAVIREDEISEKELNHNKPDNEEPEETKSLFYCIVRRLPKYFDGSKCLKGVRVGDKVSVIQENVGPGGMYHLCRLEYVDEKRGITFVDVGWFPISCLEKQKW